MKWISVKDELPEDCFDVLVCSDDDVFISTFRAGYCHGDYWFDCERDNDRCHVTHWMPKPEPARD